MRCPTASQPQHGGTPYPGVLGLEFPASVQMDAAHNFTKRNFAKQKVMKLCVRCGQTRPTTDFSRNSKTKDKLSSWCKECHSNHAVAWAAQHPDRRRRPYTQAMALAAHKRYMASREQYIKRSTEYTKAHQRETKEYRAAYEKKNRKRLREYQRRWAKQHPEKIRNRASTQRKGRRFAEGAIIERISYRAVYERDSGKCQLCRRAVSFKAMTLDHIVPVSLGGNHTMLNVQTAHRRCNSRRGAIRPTQMRMIQ